MLKSRAVLSMVAIALSATLSGVVCGQDFPSKPLRLITGSAGGGSDFDARQIAQGISGPLGQQVIVDNRPSGALAADLLAKAAPDGHTLIVAGGSVWISPLFRKMSYDVERDFSPITMIERTVNAVVVHPSLPVSSLKELIALAKARPGELNAATSLLGGPSMLAIELFKSMAGVNIVNIPYKGNAASIPAVVSGEAQLIISDVGLVAPHVKSGRLRALAITSAQPSALAPGLPTVTAAGLPGYEAVNMTGLFAPAKTPPAIIQRLNQEIVRFLHRPDVKEQFLNAGVEVIGDTPEQFGAAVKADIARTNKIIKDAGIKVER